MNFETLLFTEVPEIKDFMLHIKYINDNKVQQGRTGWVMRQIENPETIYEHMCKVNLASYYLLGFLPDEAIAHELPEGAPNGFDYIPGQITSENKRKKEEEGMKQLVLQIPNGQRWLEAWENYENKKTETSKIITSLDKICPCIEVLNLRKEYSTPNHNLEEFYPYALQRITIPQLTEVLQEMYTTKIPLSINAYQIYFTKLKKLKIN